MKRQAGEREETLVHIAQRLKANWNVYIRVGGTPANRTVVNCPTTLFQSQKAVPASLKVIPNVRTDGLYTV